MIYKNTKKRFSFENEIHNYLNNHIRKKKISSMIFAVPPVCREPSRSNLYVDYYLKKKKQNLLKIFLKSIYQYYFRNLNSIIFDFSLNFKYFFKKSKNLKNSNFIFDTFLDRSYLKQNKFEDVFLYKLDSSLSNISYVPRIIYTSFNKKELKHVIDRAYNEDNLILDFHIFNMFDYIKQFFYFIFYPFYHFYLWDFNRLSLSKYFNQCLIESLANVFIRDYRRLLFANKLNSNNKNSTIISWFENHPANKFFNYGIRKNKNNNINQIWGFQCYIFPMGYSNLQVIQWEKNLKITPDKYFINGKYYLNWHQDKNPTYLSPSFRYNKMFNQINNNISINEEQYKNRNSIILALGYFDSFSLELLKFAQNSLLKNGKVTICPHPRGTIDFDKIDLPPLWKISKKSIYEILNQCKIFIASGSGSIVEAAALGIPVIEVSPQSLRPIEYMPEIGRNILWFFSEGQESFDKNLAQLMSDYPSFQTIEKYSKLIVEQCFVNPTQKVITEFQLKHMS